VHRVAGQSPGAQAFCHKACAAPWHGSGWCLLAGVLDGNVLHARATRHGLSRHARPEHGHGRRGGRRAPWRRLCPRSGPHGDELAFRIDRERARVAILVAPRCARRERGDPRSSRPRRWRALSAMVDLVCEGHRGELRNEPPCRLCLGDELRSWCPWATTASTPTVDSSTCLVRSSVSSMISRARSKMSVGVAERSRRLPQQVSTVGGDPVVIEIESKGEPAGGAGSGPAPWPLGQSPSKVSRTMTEPTREAGIEDLPVPERARWQTWHRHRAPSCALPRGERVSPAP